MELAGLGNTGDVQFAKAGGLFQYWIPLFGGSGRNNTNDLSSTFTWLPMLTFGLSAEIVTPLPNMINDITNTTKQQQNRIRINDRVFLNNELMLRDFNDVALALVLTSLLRIQLIYCIAIVNNHLQKLDLHLEQMDNF